MVTGLSAGGAFILGFVVGALLRRRHHVRFNVTFESRDTTGRDDKDKE